MSTTKTETRQEQDNENNNNYISAGDWFWFWVWVILIGRLVLYIVTRIFNFFGSIGSSIRNKPLNDKKLEKLMKLVVLRNNGALTEEEFERERKKITKRSDD